MHKLLIGLSLFLVISACKNKKTTEVVPENTILVSLKKGEKKEVELMFSSSPGSTGLDWFVKTMADTKIAKFDSLETNAFGNPVPNWGNRVYQITGVAKGTTSAEVIMARYPKSTETYGEKIFKITVTE